jgi:NAD(P)-dependent dehydrogenase (short-subunit alcohol dehydrogenase family)
MQLKSSLEKRLGVLLTLPPIRQHNNVLTLRHAQTDMFTASPADGVAWVTGAGTGIGRAVALALAQKGFVTLLTGRRREVLDEVVRAGEIQGLSGRLYAFPCDVAQVQDMERLVETIETRHGPVALAFLNAGIAPYVKAEALDREAFQACCDVNIMGVVNALAPLLARMAQRGRGQVAVNASVAGYGGLPRAAAYGASKAALIHMCESLKFDCDRKGVRLQVVNPGFVDTPLTRSNDFPMPFQINADAAARRILDGLEQGGFEITFPRRLSWLLKAVNLLPYRLYFPLIARATGWTATRSENH